MFCILWRVSQNMQKQSQNAKNKKCTANFFASIFSLLRLSSHFAPGSAFARKVKGFCGLFFRGINKTQKLHGIRKVYSECFIFHGVFHEICKNDRKMRKTKSVQRGISRQFFHILRPFLRILRQGRLLRKKSKDFVVYFFAALIKHKICTKCKKCIVSVSYFVVRLAETFAKYPRNSEIRKVYSRICNIVE